MVFEYDRRRLVHFVAYLYYIRHELFFVVLVAVYIQLVARDPVADIGLCPNFKHASLLFSLCRTVYIKSRFFSSVWEWIEEIIFSAPFGKRRGGKEIGLFRKPRKMLLRLFSKRRPKKMKGGTL